MKCVEGLPITGIRDGECERKWRKTLKLAKVTRDSKGRGPGKRLHMLPGADTSEILRKVDWYFFFGVVSTGEAKATQQLVSASSLPMERAREQTRAPSLPLQIKGSCSTTWRRRASVGRWCRSESRRGSCGRFQSHRWRCTRVRVAPAGYGPSLPGSTAHEWWVQKASECPGISPGQPYWPAGSRRYNMHETLQIASEFGKDALWRHEDTRWKIETG